MLPYITDSEWKVESDKLLIGPDPVFRVADGDLHGDIYCYKSNTFECR